LTGLTATGRALRGAGC